ncbi:MAG: EsaB/YukD family protein, partial [Ruminococcus sp.]
MKNKAVMTVRVFASKTEHDIEVPLDITAYELFIALNEAFGLEYDTSVKEECFLRTESPIAFLTGDRILSEYHLRDGTVINLLPVDSNNTGRQIRHLKDFNYSGVSFDSAVSLSALRGLSIGNIEQCNIVDTNVLSPRIRVDLFNQNGKICLKAERGTAVSVNGRIHIFENEALALNNFDFINILSCCFYFHNNTLYMDRRANLLINGIECSNISEGISNLKYPKFVRNSRLRLKINDESITLLAPKEKPEKPKSNLL